MLKEYPVSDITLKDIASSYQQGRSNARSIESIADSIEVLVDDPKIHEDLAKVSQLANEISQIFNRLYKGIAREAMR